MMVVNSTPLFDQPPDRDRPHDVTKQRLVAPYPAVCPRLDGQRAEGAMYASDRHYALGAGSIESMMQCVDEEFAAAVSQEPGFGAYFALDTGDATVETSSTFHDNTAAEASNELASDHMRANLGEFELTRTAVSGGEVLASRMTAEGLDHAHRWRTDRPRLRDS